MRPTELVSANRVAILEQLSASIGEINQPISALVLNAEAALQLLLAQPTNTEAVRRLLVCIVKGGGRTADRGHRSPQPCADREGAAGGARTPPALEAKMRFGVRSTPCHSTNADTIGRPPDHAARSAHHRPGRCQPNERACCLLAPSIGKCRPERSRRVVSAAPRARSQTGGVNKIVVRHLAAEPKRVLLPWQSSLEF
jgi:hypothetical protein